MIDSYQLVEPTGLRTLTATSDAQGNVLLTYDDQQVASVSFAPAAVGPFATQGFFRFNPQTNGSANGVDADLTSPGFQGTVRVNYRNGSATGYIDLVVVPGFTPLLSFSGSTQAADVMRLQQRLNYWGAVDTAGKSLNTDGIVGARLNEAIQNFKATSVFPATNPNQQSTVITPATANRLNGVGILPRQSAKDVLTLVGDESNNIFRLSLDPNDPSLVRARVDSQPVESVRLRSLSSIEIYGRDGNDTIIVDTSFGPIPLQQLNINGGAGTDVLTVEDSSGRSRVVKSNYTGITFIDNDLLVEPYPTTSLRHRHVETTSTNFNGDKQTLPGPIVGTGDALATRFLGTPGQTFVMDSFELLSNGQTVTLKAIRNAQTGDLQLLVPSGGTDRVVATIMHDERLLGDKFSQSGVFAIAFSASEDDLPFDTSAAPGFQGQLRINYRNGNSNKQLDIQAVPGFWSGYQFSASDGAYRNFVLQQRLNYLGYTSNDGQSLQVNGILNAQTEQALRKFKADIVSPALDPNLQSIDLDPITIRRLNGLGSNELTVELQLLLADSLNAVANQLSKLESTGPLSTLLPLIGTTEASAVAADPTSGVTLAQLAELRSTLVNDVFAPLSEYLLADNTPSAAEFANFTQSQLNPPDYRQMQVQTAGGMTEYKVDLIRTRHTTRNYNPGSTVQQAGIELMNDTPIGVTTVVDLGLSFGLDLSQPLSSAFHFSIQHATVSLATDAPPTIDLKAGFLELPGQQHNLTLSGEVTLDPISFSIAEAQAGTLVGLITQNASGTAKSLIDVQLPLLGSQLAGGFQVGQDNNLFSGQAPALNLSNMTSLKGLMNLDPTQLATTLSQLEIIFNGLETSSALNSPVSFTRSETFGKTTNPSQAFNQSVTSLFKESNGQPAVASVQDFVGRLGASISGSQYDAATQTLSIDFDVSGSSLAKQVRLGFNKGLGEFTNISTQSEGSLSGTSNLQFTLAIDLSEEVGKGVTYTGGTALATLNANKGIIGLGIDGRTDLAITLSNGMTFEVMLDGAVTLGDVVNRIRAAAPAAVLPNGFSVDIVKDHLRFVDNTQGDSGGFSIKGANGSFAGFATVGLGILGTLAKPNRGNQFVIDGTPLHGDILSNHAYIVVDTDHQPTIAGTTNLVAKDIDAQSQLNMVAVQLGNGQGTSTPGQGASEQLFSTTLKDPNQNGKLTFTELANGLQNPASITAPTLVRGTADFDLPAATTLPGETITAGPGIKVSWSDLGDPNGAIVDFGSAYKSIEELSRIDKDAIVSLLQEIKGYLSELETIAFLQDNVPFIDKSLGSLIGSVNRFNGVIETFKQAKFTSFAELEEQLESAVEKALGVTVTAGDGTTVELLRDGHALRVNINYNPVYSDQHRLNLDLESLGIPGVGSIVDVRGGATFSVMAGANIQLSVGIDLSNPEAPREFLYDSSSASVFAKIYGKDINFKAAVGPLGVAVGNGSNNGFVVLDGDGQLEASPNANDRASVAVGLTGGVGGRVYLDDFSAGNLNVPVVTGKLNLQLPVYKKNQSAFLDANHPNLTWAFDVNNLSNLPAPSSVPNFAAIFDALRLDGAIDGFQEGWDTLFEVLDGVVDAAALLTRIPLVGSQLKDAVQFIQDLRDGVTTALSTAGERSIELLHEALYTVVGPSGLDWLQDRNANGVDMDDIVISPGSISASTSEVRVDMKLGQTKKLVNIPIGFDLGFSALNLELDGRVRLEAGFEWDLGFGISKSQGFYVSSAAKDELKIFLKASLPGFHAKGTLGFLQVDVDDLGSAVIGTINVDLKDPNEDGRLTIRELTSAPSLSQLVDAHLTVDVNIDLHLSASLEGSRAVPSIGADLHIDWRLDSASMSDGVLGGTTLPDIQLTNVTLDAGTALSRIVGPSLSKLDEFFDEFRPVIDFLNTPTPVISELLGAPMSLIDVADKLSPGLTPSDAERIRATKKFVDVANQIHELAESFKKSKSLVISIGDVSMSAIGFDPRQNQIQDLLDKLPPLPGMELLGEVKGLVDQAAAVLGTENGGVKYPIFKNPLSVIKVLFGGKPEDIVFFEYTTPKLDLDAEGGFAVGFPPAITIGVFGAIKVEGQLSVGYDASGLFKFASSLDVADIFDGFYVSDSIQPDGTDKDELSVTGSLELAAYTGARTDEFDVSAGAQGGLYADLHANLNDPDQSGKIHPSEFAEVADEGLACVVDLRGRIYAAASVSVKVEALGVTLVDETEEFAHGDILNYEHHCPGSGPGLGEVNNGVLTLLFDQQGDDSFKVTGGENGSLIVRARKLQQTFEGVTTIVGDMGAGNDLVQIASSVTIPVDLRGGLGDDTFKLGSGAATIHGDDGNDIIEGKAVKSSLVAWGDAGDDTITASAGADELHGGAGKDSITSGSGDDRAYGDDGDDYLYGGAGLDTMEGGAGDDRIFGEGGKDTLRGGAGIDVIEGGADDDIINGDQGRDILQGDDGNDIISGAQGPDTIVGGTGDDLLDGGDDDDFLEGSHGNDTIYGGAGNDEVRGSQGADTIYGGAGNDRLIAGVSEEGSETRSGNVLDGGAGIDVLYGDLGGDKLYGGADSDVIYGLSGADAIDGGTGSDVIVGGTGSDHIVGGWGSDTIYSGQNESGDGSTTDKNVVFGDAENGSAPGGPELESDLIFGDVGADTISGGLGNDTIHGLAGSDVITGDAGADVIYAGTNELGGGNSSDVNTVYGDDAAQAIVGLQHGDRIFGDIGPDTIYGGPGNDIVFSLTGNDTIYAGAGDDTVDAGDGKDVVLGNAGNDSLQLGAGNDEAQGNEGNDTIVLGQGDDLASGGIGDDTIEGGDGSDIIWGGDATVTFTRDAASLTYPTNFPDQTFVGTTGTKPIVPIVLAGLSMEGLVDDGEDQIAGGTGTDWLFGGSGGDRLDGSAGDDYVDGGAGDDLVRGGLGDDVVRGGSDNDVVNGDDGIDQLFGDDGVDHLFGGAGTTNVTLGSLVGQRLFGGQGIDYLYAYSYSFDVTAEAGLPGDEIHGGGGNDWIYGSIRSETLYGDDGNETIEGDALIGPSYAPHSDRSRRGGDDTIVGGAGEDRLYGGGGNDTLWGGMDSDWLEGQNGVDKLYGGSDIDILVLDTSFTYDPIPPGQHEVFDGHYGNITPDLSSDDNATDILQIDGTNVSDTIQLGQVPDNNESLLAVTIQSGSQSRYFTAHWRDFSDTQDANGRPLVEQFRIAGLGGDDSLGFVSQNTPVRVADGQVVAAGGSEIIVQPLDVSDLDQRSDDFVGVLDGGSGDDTLRGTNARDRLDGGFGSDTLYGNAGDDQLWGDGGAGFGSRADFDRLYGGTGQ